MPITRPVTKTIISSPAWGIPITDQVNANTTDIANLKPTAWTNVTFLNGWLNYGSPYQVVQYRRVGDIVSLRGIAKGGAAFVPIFTLPVGFRPPGQIQFAVDAGNAHGNVEIRTNGDVVMNFPQTTATAFNIMADFSTTA